MSREKELITKLDLKPHPEGGFLKKRTEVKGVINEAELSDEFKGDRNFCTGIYFLLTSDTFSAFHRIKQDEMWHFYEGSSITIHMIDTFGNYYSQKLGLDIDNGELPQYTVLKDTWFATKVNNPDFYTLVGCTVSPGFDFQDFELANKDNLISSYPSHQAIITEFTRS